MKKDLKRDESRNSNKRIRREIFGYNNNFQD